MEMCPSCLEPTPGHSGSPSNLHCQPLGLGEDWGVHTDYLKMFQKLKGTWIFILLMAPPPLPPAEV